MASWQEFAAAAPNLAAFGSQRLERRVAYLATTRADGAPRVHPVSPFIVQGHLFVYMEPTSPKGHDLQRDDRYALHCSVEDTSGGAGEFIISGRAKLIDDPAMRAVAFEARKAAGHSPKDRYVVFELSVESALSTTYEDGQPIQKRWKAR